MTNLLHKDANRIACGKCCPPPGQRVRVTPRDDPTIRSERCVEWEDLALGNADITANGDQVVPLRPDGRCTYLADGNTHCTLVIGNIDRRPEVCRDGRWPVSSCAQLACLKLERR